MYIHRTFRKEQIKSASREAAEWLAIISRNPDSAENKAFMDWLCESPVHVRELLVAQMLEQELSVPGALDGFDLEAVVSRAGKVDVVVPMSELPVHQAAVRPRPVGNRRRRGISRALTWASAAALVCVLALGTIAAWRTLAPTYGGHVYSTALGQQRVVTLADGTTVTMAPLTRMIVRLVGDKRNVRLRTGAAWFNVVHDSSRPFRVYAGASVILDVGTRFRVNRLPSGTVVNVTEGEVKVTVDHWSALDEGIDAWIKSWMPADTDAIQQRGVVITKLDRARTLVAGQSAHISRNGGELALAPTAHVPPNPAGKKRLTFHDNTLADIATEFNRYNTTQIVVYGEQARMQRYSGVFDADDSASFLQYLICCSRVQVIHRDKSKVVVRLPAEPTADAASASR